MISRSFAWMSLVLVGLSWGQTAETNFRVVRATKDLVELAWVAAPEASYQVERRVPGGTYALMAALEPGVGQWVDAKVEATGIYEYRLSVFGGEAIPGELKVGPPAPGVQVAMPLPVSMEKQEAGIDRFGWQASLALDGSGDPAFLYLIFDPAGDSTPEKSELWFRRWDRKTANWADPVRVATIGIVGAGRAPFVLQFDASEGAWVALTENANENRLELYTSGDGVSWLRRGATEASVEAPAMAPGLVVAKGVFHASYQRGERGTYYWTGTWKADASQWELRQLPLLAGAEASVDVVTTDLGLDAAGKPVIAYFAWDPLAGHVLHYWSAATGKASKVADSAGNWSATNDVRLRMENGNPRVLFTTQRDESMDAGMVWSAGSEDGGVSWSEPVRVPKDPGEDSLDAPFDLAIDAKGNRAAVISSLSSRGGGDCQGWKLSRRGQDGKWSTCSVKSARPGMSFDDYPASLQVRYGVDGRLMVLWQQVTPVPEGVGLMLWREPTKE